WRACIVLCVVSVLLLATKVVAFGVFFFSSRRRHTRFSRDWSSDVCSSDLRPEPWTRAARSLLSSWAGAVDDEPTENSLTRRLERSEERRVGKECGSRWPRQAEKKNKQNTQGKESREEA